MGGLEASCYDIDDNKILVTLQHGWRGSEAKEFLLSREEVQEVMWNEKTFYPSQEDD